jgi:hypothetical protein
VGTPIQIAAGRVKTPPVRRLARPPPLRETREDVTDTLAHLAYDEATAAIAAQGAAVDSLRSRATTLLATASLVTSFLGGQVLVRPTIAADGAIVRADLGTWSLVAIGLFVGVAVLTVLVLWPYDWRFALSARVILSAPSVSPQLDAAAVRAQLAEYHEDNYDRNARTLDRLFTYFRVGCVLLAGETLAWIINLTE